MKVVNFNDEFRCALLDAADSSEKIKNLYNFFLDDEVHLEYVLGLVFFSAYVYAYYTCKKDFIDENSDDLFDELYYEEYKLMVEYADEFDNVSELFSEADTFLNYFLIFEDFSNLPKSSKSELVRLALEKSEFLIKMFPAAINDYLYYCNDYDPDDIVDDYNDKLSYFKDDE